MGTHPLTIFSKVFLGFQNFAYEFLGQDVECDFSDTCDANIFANVYGRAEGLACADLGARTPIVVSGNIPETKYDNFRSTAWGMVLSCQHIQMGRQVDLCI